MVIIKDPKLMTFEKVVSNGTVHAAARELGLSQVAVTKRIKELESQLKVTLFLRSRKGMRLTSEGQALLRYCLSTQEAEGLLLSQITNEQGHDVSLTVIGPTSAISTRVVSCCSDLYGKYPFLRLHLRSEDHKNIVDLVKNGAADFGIVPTQNVPNEMESKTLKPDRYLLVAPPAWRHRQLSEIIQNERIIDFYEQDSTTLKYLKKFELDKVVRRGRLFVNENEALIHLFRQGIGFGTLTESVAAPHIESENLIKLNRGQALEDPLALVWYRRSREMAYFDGLIRAIR
jgi:LysR family transcriptional regulator, chromosome initiation inhibitor